MRLRVLIACDNDAFCRFLSEFLEREGHSARTVRGFREMSREAGAERTDLVIIEDDGNRAGVPEFLTRLQRAEETHHLPVIVISADPDLEFELLHIFDFIAKPVDIARLRDDLEAVARRRKRRPAAHLPPSLSDDDYQLFHDYLLGASGLHFERRNVKLLERGIASRMVALHLATPRDYHDFLVKHQENRRELQKFLQFLTIGETYFFRYRVHYEALRRLLTGELAPAPGRRLRIWSAGCSTGEEPYSIAMTIMETVPHWRDSDIKVLATDINNRSLRQAREGVYRPWSLRVTDRHMQERYFERVGDSYLLRDEARRLVEFGHLNLQSAEYPSPTGEFRDVDVIFCRNVLIYFSLATARRVVERLAETLRPGGYLFLGHAEAISQLSGRFERVSEDGGFYYRKKATDAPHVPAERVKPAVRRPVRSVPPAPPSRVRTAPPSPLPAKSERSVAELFREAGVFFEAEDFGGAERCIDEILRREPDHVGALAARGFILANRGEFPAALDICDRVQALDDLCADTYFLRGLIYDMTDQMTEAVTEYRKALLLRMEFVMPHYYLARLYFRIGCPREGARELRNCLKILTKAPEEQVVPYSGGMSREVLLERIRGELVRVA